MKCRCFPILIYECRPSVLERAMFRRFILAIVAVAALGIMFGATGASADPYKWCAVYTFDIEIRECGFVTIEQCRASISGVGGYCEPNPFYTAPDEKPAKRPRKRHND
jgi:hypothetical protein